MLNTLHIEFPDIWRGWDMKECNLISVLDSDVHSPTSDCDPAPEAIAVSVDPKTTTDYYSDCPVFRGILQRPSHPYERTTVALKFAMRDDLIADLVEETEMYIGPLEPLQGSTVPRCYGLYAGTGMEDQAIACLVLEYWGEVIQKPFSQLPMELRVRILERLGKIHQQGLLHGDFAERNVLQKNGDVRIIDFDRAVPHQHCDFDMNFHAGEKLPDQKKFGCEHLWDICRRNMMIWKN
ncbi:hypothetical protein BDZ97DRAFT_1832592 [Flammula alnicola]|nr:hypothetical protein BDZ97DRAFT_1832592 [Flammula alnicola]